VGDKHSGIRFGPLPGADIAYVLGNRRQRIPAPQPGELVLHGAGSLIEVLIDPDAFRLPVSRMQVQRESVRSSLIDVNHPVTDLRMIDVNHVHTLVESQSSNPIEKRGKPSVFRVRASNFETRRGFPLRLRQRDANQTAAVDSRSKSRVEMHSRSGQKKSGVSSVGLKTFSR
jgi:hypothetical protein